MTAATRYLVLTGELLEAEERHDARAEAAFHKADKELCERINSTSEHAEEFRKLRQTLYVLHSKWRIRRAGVVAESPTMLAAAIAVTRNGL